MRIENSGTRYFSFAELGQSFGIKPIKKIAKEEMLSKFSKKHVCPICKQPLIYHMNSNVMTCNNDVCKGHKHTKKNDDGTETVFYTPVFETLNVKDSRLASSLFEKKEN